MNTKYEFTGETKEIDGVTVNRIRVIKDFDSYKAGDLGGWVESEHNLSQDGNAWVSSNACVYGNARVYGDACVYGNARVCDNAWVYGNARVYGNAWVYGNVCVYGNARVFGNVWVSSNACVYGNARVYHNACVYGNAWVYDNACVYGDACVYGNAHIRGDAKVYDKARISFGILTTDIKSSLKTNILVQTGLMAEDDHVIAYKRVKSDLSSEFDESFVYKVGEWAEATNPDLSNKSCASGLHVSHPTFYAKGSDDHNFCILKCKVMLNDIITIQEGKIRCKRLFVEKIVC